MPLDSMTRKRMLESDADNGYPSSRTRRQRTTPATAVGPAGTAKTLRSTPLQPTSRILKPTTSGNARQEVTKATTLATISKPEPPLPSGIPRSVALKAKLATLGNGTKPKGTRAGTSGNEPSASTANRSSSTPQLIAKAGKSKENLRVASNGKATVSKPLMEQPSSKHGAAETTASSKPRTSSFSRLPAPQDAPIAAKQCPSMPRNGMLPPSTFTRSNSQTNLNLSASTTPPPQASTPAVHPRSHPERESKVATKERESGTTVYTDSAGFVHLAPADCELFLSFPSPPHYEVWDVLDDSHISCPAWLYIMAKEPTKWGDCALSTPDVTLVEIQCRTKLGPSRFCDRQSPVDHWQCTFDGVELPTSTGLNVGANVPPGTVSIERKWDRIYSMPAVGKACEGEDLTKRVCATPPEAPSRKPSYSSGLAALLFPGSNTASKRDDDDDDEVSNVVVFSPPTVETKAGSVKQIPGRGWCMKFWVPVPAHLFLKKETRIFEIEAKVHIVPGGMDGVGMVDYGAITSRTEMTVSHLRSEREMDLF